jgi:GT2 family glycosyltransferase
MEELSNRARTAGGGELPAVSLIIPSRNRPELLAETVDSVLAGRQVPAEIVIVDQSDDPNEALRARHCERCRITYTWLSRPGVSRARNHGIRTAQHGLLAFIDDDVRVHADWFENLVRAHLAAGDRAVVSGRVLPEQPPTAHGFVPSTIESEEPVVYEGRIGMDILYSNNMIMPREAAEGVGLFDERLGAGTPFQNAEDNDLAYRLLEAGYRIHYAPEPVVEHRAWRTGRDYLPLRWSYGRGQGGFYAKHFDLRDRYMIHRAAYDAKQRLIRCARLAAAREPRRALGQLVYLTGLLTAMAQWLLTRSRTPAVPRLP